MKPVEQMTCEELEQWLGWMVDEYVYIDHAVQEFYDLLRELKARRLAQSAG